VGGRPYSIDIDVVTQMRINSDRLFHLLLTRVMNDAVVSIVLDGDWTIRADVPLCTPVGEIRVVVATMRADGQVLRLGRCSDSQTRA